MKIDSLSALDDYLVHHMKRTLTMLTENYEMSGKLDTFGHARMLTLIGLAKDIEFMSIDLIEQIQALDELEGRVA